jgi:hypothetical protein
MSWEVIRLSRFGGCWGIGEGYLLIAMICVLELIMDECWSIWVGNVTYFRYYCRIFGNIESLELSYTSIAA